MFRKKQKSLSVFLLPSNATSIFIDEQLTVWYELWQPTPVFLPGESHGWRSLVSYSPRGHKESDTTEWLNWTELMLSHVQLFATPWTVAYQAPPSMGFSRQEYWSGVPLPSPAIGIYTFPAFWISPHTSRLIQSPCLRCLTSFTKSNASKVHPGT